GAPARRSAGAGGGLRACLRGPPGGRAPQAVQGGGPQAAACVSRANTSRNVSENALRSSGLRLVTSLAGAWSQTFTCSSIQVAPALRRSVCRLGQLVSTRPRTTSASIRVQGA